MVRVGAGTARWYAAGVRVVALLVVAACGSDGHHLADAPPSNAEAGASDAPLIVDGTPTDSLVVDASADATPMLDAFPSTLDVKLDCHNDCKLHATPASISVMAGTGFTVNWINVGDTACDVAKIDQFNQVPIVLDLEPGDSYHDTVRTWCGTQFTGTFDFRIDICTLPNYIPVDCGAP